MLRERQANDSFRRSLTGGRLILTQKVAALDPDVQAALLRQVVKFESFDHDVPEHDLGVVEAMGYRVWFKIDSFTRSSDISSRLPIDSEKTLTILYPDEW